MRPIFVLFLIIGLLLAPQVYNSLRLNKEIGTKSDLAIDKIKNNFDREGEQNGYVHVAGATLPFTEKKLHQILKTQQQKLQHLFTWQWQGITKVTASAPGLDRKHHFVNSYLVGFKPFDTEHIWVPLYTLAVRKRYQYDHVQYSNYNEVWQNSRQAFYYTRGDCEDHALILADWLIALGYDARVVVGTYKSEGHAWVVLFKDGHEYLLEATSKRKTRNFKTYQLASLQTEYQPEYQFNRERFWFNMGSKYTTRYSGAKWKYKSKFVPGRVKIY